MSELGFKSFVCLADKICLWRSVYICTCVDELSNDFVLITYGEFC